MVAAAARGWAALRPRVTMQQEPVTMRRSLAACRRQRAALAALPRHTYMYALRPYARYRAVPRVPCTVHSAAVAMGLAARTAVPYPDSPY
jgi:hypothetical protein